MRKVFAALVIVSIIMLAPSSYAKKPRVIRAKGGTNMSPPGLVVDASYDPRFDSLVPGYKVINVVVMNQSFDIIYMNPEKDKWLIKLANTPKPVEALFDLRRQDPKAWSQLPDRAKSLIGYPLVLPVGARDVIDIFVPASLDVQEFNEVHIYIKSIDMWFEVLVTQ